ncbi:MAG: hypothetical protein JWR19_1894 [Pedosphaera sp.]|nr:hypothetical protein [Pedosphaera sp.]
MLAGNKISVPSYQRAYSWDTETDSSKAPKQTKVFLSDLESYSKSSNRSPYYFGHFLFEDKLSNCFHVIDGQQRLTTIVIYLSTLFSRLKSLRPLTEVERECFEDIIKRNSTYRFSTVDYDSQLFRDYVIDQSIKNKNGFDTESVKRIGRAFDYFVQHNSDKNEQYLRTMLNVIQIASCTTHLVTDESEAIQMFIFQNNRGKKPSNLEIIKAQFMFSVHLFGGEEKEELIAEIKNRFEKIYKSISSIDYQIDEDDVLLYTLKVHFNSLWESNPIEKINRLLSEENPIPFVKAFTHSLAVSFEYLTAFFGKDERESMPIHSLITLGDIAMAIPFIIKAYTFSLTKVQIGNLCSTLESIVLRHRLVGTRADITSRINDVYQKFIDTNCDIKPIREVVEQLKTAPSNTWWGYWNNGEFERSIQGLIHHPTAKYLLWKYECFLESHGKDGYALSRFDRITSPELEHIAPQTPSDNEPVEAGYCEYDEEFKREYIDCVGNYLLISKSHNCSVGNKPFADKLASYTHLSQQREIKDMTIGGMKWSKELITKRKAKIIDFILKNF